MNASVLRALAADAYHEVLDNWVFRILALLTLLPILFTFTVGLGPDSVELLFGLKSWSYAELFSTFGMAALPPDPQGTVIGIVLSLCFEFLAGSLGMLLSIAATAFFVPRMLEKGTAELYFHKPVSRAWLLLSRYFAGLVFIALVASVLVAGMYLGLLLVSGYGEPGVLVAALQLVYTFALIHSFSVLCGVVTRSTVASILLSSFFFFFNGCIHQGWIAWEQASRGPNLELERTQPGDADRNDSQRNDGDRNADGNPVTAEPVERELEPDEPGPVVRALRTTLDALHLVLPKTTDADFFARKLRKALDRPTFRDADSLVTLFRLAPDLEPLDQAALAALDPDPALRAALGEARFAARSADGTLHALWRRPAKKSETRIGERVRVREEASSQAGEDLEDLLAAGGALALTRESGRFGSDAGGRELSGASLAWQDAKGAPRRARVFRGSNADWMYTLLVEAAGPRTAPTVPAGADPAAAAEPVPDETADALLDQLGLDLASVEDWYPSQLGFTAPLRFNILFSVGSSLAFAAAMFGLALWRLRRVAF